MSLETIAMRWLWLEKNCHYILRERIPRWGTGDPDVLGITKDRYFIEIEIKRSVSDFLADAKKPHRKNREFYIEQQPKYFYYFAPKEIAEKIVDRIPPWAGLLYSDGITAISMKPAPANTKSRRVCLKECVKVTRQMVNHLMSLEIKIDHQMNSWRQDRWHDYAPVNGDYQI